VYFNEHNDDRPTVMPVPGEHIGVICLVILFTNTMRFPVASSLSVTVPPASLLLSGNPWGVTFEEIRSTGFALERVELLPNQMWEITGRLTIHESAVYTTEATAVDRVPVIFLAPPGVVIPTESRNVQAFLSSSRSSVQTLKPWILQGRKDELTLFKSSHKYHFIVGNFSYSEIPTNTLNTATVMPSATTSASLIEKHPSIDGTSMVRITIPHTAVKILSPADDSSETRDIVVGVALLSRTDMTQDHIYSGVVRLLDFKNTPIIRSFTALTSTRYTFLTHTAMQVVETQINKVWTYVAVITFGFETGVISPYIDTSKGFFAVATSISRGDASAWKPIQCPSAPLESLNGCAMDIFPANASFCTTETIVIGEDIPPVYRIRVQLGQYASQPEPSDNVFIRMLVEGVDDGGSKIQSFMNVQTRLIASSIRCGALIVREPSVTDPVDEDTYSGTDPVVMSVYSGTTLTPMTQDKTGAPLVQSTEAYPTTISSVSNLHARSILDSLVTITLIGYDYAFQLSRKVFMVDLISVHVCDESLYNVLNSMVRTGVAYSVDFTTKRLTISPEFDLLCNDGSEVCARRVLISDSVLLQPSHAHIDMSLTEDIEWLNMLFDDVTTSTTIAETFGRNVYKTINPNSIYRRVVWVDSTYTWPASSKGPYKDRMLLIASFNEG